jgi:hypothetical protein
MGWTDFGLQGWFAVGLHRSLEPPEKPGKIDLQLVCTWFALQG